MQWTDEAIILATRRHGETSLILELMTAAHGRHLGLVRGGRTRRRLPFLQPGNSVEVTWRARLDEHLGHLAVDTTVERASRLMEGAAGLYGLQMLAALLRLLPERDPHPALHAALGPALDALENPLAAGEVLIRFELAMLNELGFGLDLSQCAATGTTVDLAFVSPRTGRAVSRAAGDAYSERLLALPRFLTRGANAPPTAAELHAAFGLTGYFFERHVYEPRGIAAEPSRERLLALIATSDLKASGPLESAGIGR
jgi:DNA repair protein RecO (recombination protein O)